VAQKRGTKPIGRESIADAALALIDRQGLDGFSMRGLGRELGVDPMMIYRHYPNRDAVLYGALDAMLAELEVATSGDPKDPASAMGLAHGFRNMLHAHPNLVPLLAQRSGGATNPAALGSQEAALALARQVGFEGEQVVYAYITMASFVVGFVVSELGQVSTLEPSETDAQMERLAARAGTLPPDEFPNLVAHARDLYDFDFDAAFDFGLQTILLGLAGMTESMISGDSLKPHVDAS